MRQSNRAERRHHVQRLKSKRRTYWGYPSNYTVSSIRNPPSAPVEMEARQLGQVVHTPQLCSCSMCCNRRRCLWEKGDRISIQEKRQASILKEQIEEAEEDLKDKDE